MAFTPKSIKYLLYVRKSSEDKGKQVLSLEAQIYELTEFAKKHNYLIHATFSDEQTAKKPGRKNFNKMLAAVEAGFPFPIGILSWDPDRLTRNKYDEFRICELVDKGKIADLKFPHFTFDNTPSGKLTLSFQFAFAKFHIDKLAVDVKRGQREKLRQGGWPGQVAVGYRRDLRSRNIAPDKKTAPGIAKAFEEYATGLHTYNSIATLLAKYGILNENRTPHRKSTVYRILTNPIYVGLMKWNGEMYEGSFKPIISKRLFDRVQNVLKQKSRCCKPDTRHNFAFRGLFHCSCGAMITAQWARGKCGGLYRYYRCTKKKGTCNEPYIQESKLRDKILDSLMTITPSMQWLSLINAELGLLAQAEKARFREHMNQLSYQIAELDRKLSTILDDYLERVIDQDSYIRKKEELVRRKVSLKHEQDTLFKSQTATWIEPTEEVIKTLQSLTELNRETPLHEISILFRKIGSNPKISNKNLLFTFLQPYDFMAQQVAKFEKCQESQSAEAAAKNRQRCLVRQFLDYARTLFDASLALQRTN